jgi:cupin superfamily acireductone dioxygenase involved in methionine salvage
MVFDHFWNNGCVRDFRAQENRVKFFRVQIMKADLISVPPEFIHRSQRDCMIEALRIRMRENHGHNQFFNHLWLYA